MLGICIYISNLVNKIYELLENENNIINHNSPRLNYVVIA